MKQIEVLHVVGSYFPATGYGGPIHSIHQLCRELAGQGGAEVSVYTTNINGRERLDVETGVPVRIDGVNVAYCDITVGGKIVFSVDHLLRLRRHLRAFDIVHLHSVFSLTTLYGSALCRSMRVPYLVTPRGSLAPAFVERRGRWRKRAWLGLFDRKSLERANAVHVTSDKEAEDIRLSGIRPRRLAVIPNGVDADIFLPPSGRETEVFRQRLGIDDTEPVVLFLGRLNWEKGLDILISACGILARGGLAFRLVLAGPDPEGYRAQLERMVADEGLSSRVIFPGALAGIEKKACLAASCVVVLPSLSENFGLAAAEGMAIGRPVVVTEGVGIASDVRKSGGGLVVAPDARSLAEGIGAVLRDPSGAQEMAKNAASFAKERYSWPAVATRMLQLYRNILDG